LEGAHSIEKWKNMGFRTNIIVRVALIFLLGLGASYIAMNTAFWLVSVWMIAFTILSLVALIRFLEKYRRELSNFLMSLQQNDFTNTYPSTNNKKNDLYHAFNVISSEFKKVRSQKESNFHFLQAIVEHTGVALICYSEESLKVKLMNEAAKSLFNKPYLTSIKSLNTVSSELVSSLTAHTSRSKQLLKIKIENELLPISMIIKSLVLEGENYKLIAFHDIRHELEEKELESWQKLMRVLTHEIRNSTIPISTLSEVVLQLFLDGNNERKSKNEIDDHTIEDAVEGLATIQKRSKGLVKFINTYNQLNKLPEPEFKNVCLNEVLTTVENLMRPTAENQKVELEITYNPKDKKINIDAQLIEQVLINLIKNAIEALENTDKPIISIEVSSTKYGSSITVHDNGPGIPEEAMDNIFTPFYTTKKDGSGIGLSLSRQIMKLHHGKISVKSITDSGTLFQLHF
jgi:two-component system, NtrC family, nitrogen regulation sensor histidine kinase NtrY